MVELDRKGSKNREKKKNGDDVNNTQAETMKHCGSHGWMRHRLLNKVLCLTDVLQLPSAVKSTCHPHDYAFQSLFGVSV